MNKLDMYRIAREAGADAWTNIAPETATIYHFCVMHIVSAVDGTCITEKPECEVAEAIDCSDDFTKNQIAMEYVTSYLNAHNIPWGSFTVQTPYKYEHGHENSYHYCFRAIVKPRVEEEEEEELINAEEA